MASEKAQAFTPEEVALFREWFDSVQDLNPGYLEKKDYVLAEKLYKQLGMRVPNSIKEHLPWVLASESIPDNEPGRWSEEVIVLMLSGDILKLSCMDGYWQRPASVDDQDSVLAWMPIPPMP